VGRIALRSGKITQRLGLHLHKEQVGKNDHLQDNVLEALDAL
jgi:hypothetical protein